MNTELFSALACCASESCSACPYAGTSDPCQIALAYDLLDLLAADHSAEAAQLASSLRSNLDCWEGISDGPLPEEDFPELFSRIHLYMKDHAYE